MKNLNLIFLSIIAACTLTFSSCDKCKKVECKNGGTCDKGDCKCPTGTEGDFCETAWRDKFIGSYKGIRTCTYYNADSVITITIKEGTNINNMYIEVDGGIYIGTLQTANTFSYSFDYGGDKLTLTGKLEGNNLTFTEKIEGSFGYTCNFKGTKQ